MIWRKLSIHYFYLTTNVCCHVYVHVYRLPRVWDRAPKSICVFEIIDNKRRRHFFLHPGGAHHLLPWCVCCPISYFCANGSWCKHRQRQKVKVGGDEGEVGCSQSVFICLCFFYFYFYLWPDVLYHFLGFLWYFFTLIYFTRYCTEFCFSIYFITDSLYFFILFCFSQVHIYLFQPLIGLLLLHPLVISSFLSLHLSVFGSLVFLYIPFSASYLFVILSFLLPFPCLPHFWFFGLLYFPFLSSHWIATVTYLFSPVALNLLSYYCYSCLALCNFFFITHHTFG